MTKSFCFKVKNLAFQARSDSVGSTVAVIYLFIFFTELYTLQGAKKTKQKKGPTPEVIKAGVLWVRIFTSPVAFEVLFQGESPDFANALIVSSLILNFCNLPVTVMGNSLTNLI